MTITWAAVAGATSYDYQVGTGAVLSTTGTSVSLSGLAVGNTAFKLRATNSGGSSAYTAATIVYTVPVVAPRGPGAQRHLQHDHRQRDDHVGRCEPAPRAMTTRSAPARCCRTTGTSVSLSGLAVGNTAFKLRATNAGGSSAYTAATIVYTVPVVARPPWRPGAERRRTTRPPAT